ncbi:MAG TPA: hypothetical protein VGZ22_03880 [Isosphaeraceae bacterium]|jgi:hypothetical protein|nr:hypothetical protein [Isosphaeraceae bacterium]
MPGLPARTRRRSLVGFGSGIGATVLALLTTFHASQGEPTEAPAADTTVWRTGVPVPIAVAGGKTRFDVPTPVPGSKTMVVVSVLAKSAGPFPIRLATWQGRKASAPPLADDGPLRPAQLVPLKAMPVPPAVSQASLPPEERRFHLMVRDGDVASASNYLSVPGRLRAVGNRVQVYVDVQDVASVKDDLLRDLVTTFDDQVFPTAAQWLGVARDVDGDGRFTVLITGWLARLGGGRLAVDGFVRGADLDPDLGAPFGNRCDMMYLSATTAPGPHLRTILAHEYTHAVTASLKAFNGPEGAHVGREEEGWLDEALAHLAEDLHGFSRTNLDYRVSAFLSCPERYRLVVDDYYTADLFRSHGNRGSTYLFLRWCADRYGPQLLTTLVRSPKRGIENLEAATGTPFSALFRQWTIALTTSGLRLETPDAAGYRELNLRGEIDGWPLAGPRASRVRSGGPAETWSATGTSSHFCLVEGSGTGSVQIEIAGPPDADLQVTAIPLPPELARLDLTVQAAPGADGKLWARARLQERDGTPVRLSSLGWEPLVPANDPHNSLPRHGQLDQLGIAAAFGTSALPARGQLASQPIALAGISRQDGPLILKAIGTDSHGRRVAAWAELSLTPADLAAEGTREP